MGLLWRKSNEQYCFLQIWDWINTCFYRSGLSYKSEIPDKFLELINYICRYI